VGAAPPAGRRGRDGGAAHAAFELGALFKGIDGLLELVGGALLLAVPPARIAALLRALTQHELSEDPHDFLARHLTLAAGHLTQGGERFAAAYLLVHGVVKVGLVWALLRAKLWAYPLAIALFAAFGVYQLYRWSLSRSAALIVLTILDALVIVLTWIEWRRLRGEQRAAPPARA
jgi:uncharacterized membrane protein